MVKYITDLTSERIPSHISVLENSFLLITESCYFPESLRPKFQYFDFSTFPHSESLDKALNQGNFFFRSSSDLERGTIIGKLVALFPNVRVITTKEKQFKEYFPKLKTNPLNLQEANIVRPVENGIKVKVENKESEKKIVIESRPYDVQGEQEKWGKNESVVGKKGPMIGEVRPLIDASRQSMVRTSPEVLQAKPDIRSFQAKADDLQARSLGSYQARPEEFQAKSVNSYQAKPEDLQAKSVSSFQAKFDDFQTKSLSSYQTRPDEFQEKFELRSLQVKPEAFLPKADNASLQVNPNYFPVKTENSSIQLNPNYFTAKPELRIIQEKLDPISKCKNIQGFQIRVFETEPLLKSVFDQVRLADEMRRVSKFYQLFDFVCEACYKSLGEKLFEDLTDIKRVVFALFEHRVVVIKDPSRAIENLFAKNCWNIDVEYKLVS